MHVLNWLQPGLRRYLVIRRVFDRGIRGIKRCRLLFRVLWLRLREVGISDFGLWISQLRPSVRYSHLYSARISFGVQCNRAMLRGMLKRDLPA